MYQKFNCFKFIAPTQEYVMLISKVYPMGHQMVFRRSIHFDSLYLFIYIIIYYSILNVKIRAEQRELTKIFNNSVF